VDQNNILLVKKIIGLAREDLLLAGGAAGRCSTLGYIGFARGAENRHEL
jgi:hypothetical protein